MSIDNSHQISDVKVMISQGADGVGIESIEKTSSQGIEDTYTITLSDGRKSVFTVTNGNGIDHIAKTGEQGLVDEYTIYFDDNSTYVYYVTNGQGGGMSAEFLITSDAGSTITVTNPSGQSIPVSQVTGSTTEWTCSDTQYGTYTVESDLDGDTVTVSVTVDNCKIYSVSALHDPVPEGSTVTPTDNIQIWLHCAEIFDKSYTLLSEVLADTDTLVALMANDNAVDYLVRSTTWATDISADETAMQAIGASDYCSDTLLADSTWCDAIANSAYIESVINIKVPTMTSNTTPSGVASASVDNNIAYKAFDGNNSTYWQITGAGQTSAWLQYMFVEAVCVKVLYLYQVGFGNATIILKGSNDGTNFDTLHTISQTTLNETYSIPINNSTEYKYYRLEMSRSTIANYGLSKVQFYGRQNGGVQTWLHEANITDKDYTTLAEVLADSTTLSALMASQDAVDYMVGCTEWADTICADSTAMSYIGLNNYCANTLLADNTWLSAIVNSDYIESVLNVKVPTMTSDNTPSGVCSASSTTSPSTPWKAFDGSNSTSWQLGDATSGWVQYQFTSAKAIKAVYIYTNEVALRWGSGKIQGSTDGSNFVDLLTLDVSQSSYNSVFVLTGVSASYSYLRCALTKATNANGKPYIYTIQFYGREDV